jgi:fumarate reductase flavoprotein subunit
MADFGRFVMNMMKERAKTYGVEILTKHPVVDVEVEKGKIIAAIAKSDAGYVRIACRACVLATGSWIRNDEILKRYVPKYYEAIQYMKSKGEQSGAPGGNGDPKIGHTSPNYTGDGIALAEKVGAFVDYASFCIRPMGPLPGAGGGGTFFRAMAQSPFIITVNLEGRRYCCEPVIMNLGLFDGGSVLMEQPGAQSWDIFDENTIAAALKYQKLPESKKTPKKNVELSPDFEISLPDTMKEIHEELKKNSSSMIKAATLEELADKIGINKNNFLDTVKRYNQGCETGVDEFFKDKRHLAPINRPPYYAFKGVFGTNGAFGGVRVNPEMQVYKSDHFSLVEGLYAAGDFASGRHVSIGGVKRQVINDLSWAFSSGFLAGTNAAGYLKGLD